MMNMKAKRKAQCLMGVSAAGFCVMMNCLYDKLNTEAIKYIITAFLTYFPLVFAMRIQRDDK